MVALYKNGKLRLKLPFLGKNWTTNRIVIVKRKYIFEVETPPHHAICPLMRYFKPMEVASFVYNKETVLFFVSE